MEVVGSILWMYGEKTLDNVWSLYVMQEVQVGDNIYLRCLNQRTSHQKFTGEHVGWVKGYALIDLLYDYRHDKDVMLWAITQMSILTGKTPQEVAKRYNWDESKIEQYKEEHRNKVARLLGLKDSKTLEDELLRAGDDGRGNDHDELSSDMVYGIGDLD